MTYLKPIDDVDLIRIESGSIPASEAIPRMVEHIRELTRKRDDAVNLEDFTDERLADATESIRIAIDDCVELEDIIDRTCDKLADLIQNPPEPGEELDTVIETMQSVYQPLGQMLTKLEKSYENL